MVQIVLYTSVGVAAGIAFAVLAKLAPDVLRDPVFWFFAGTTTIGLIVAVTVEAAAGRTRDVLGARLSELEDRLEDLEGRLPDHDLEILRRSNDEEM